MRVSYWYLAVELHGDGLGFSTSYSSYKKYGEAATHSWSYLKEKCSSKSIISAYSKPLSSSGR